MSGHSQIVSRPIASIQPAHRNPRTHSRKQVRQIADSIQRFGFVTPILIDQEHRIVAGHGRWSAAKSLGISEVPTLLIDHLGGKNSKPLHLPIISWPAWLAGIAACSRWSWPSWSC